MLNTFVFVPDRHRVDVRVGDAAEIHRLVPEPVGHPVSASNARAFCNRGARGLWPQWYNANALRTAIG